MPKKTSDGVLTMAHPTEGEGTPPLLSEKFIARLQAAVEAAQRRQVPPPRYVMDCEEETWSTQ
jgi:hypothetical protein